MAIEGVARAAGFLGDGLTFVGSLFLAVDALFKRKEQMLAARRSAIARDFPDSAQTKDGQLLTPAWIEEDALQRSILWARIGAVLLVLGFACLLVSRWCE
jgi:hypothetical protein